MRKRGGNYVVTAFAFFPSILPFLIRSIRPIAFHPFVIDAWEADPSSVSHIPLFPYQVTSPAPARVLAMRANEKSRSDRRLR